MHLHIAVLKTSEHLVGDCLGTSPRLAVRPNCTSATYELLAVAYGVPDSCEHDGLAISFLSKIDSQALQDASPSPPRSWQTETFLRQIQEQSQV